MVIASEFADDYTCEDLGPIPDVPRKWGAIAAMPDDPNALLIGGNSNEANGMLYRVQVARDELCRIVGFADEPVIAFAQAQYNDGGATYHPDGTLFLARWPENEIGQLIPGSTTTDRVINLTPFLVTPSPGGLTFVPPGFAAADQLKLVTWATGDWYTIAISPLGDGTFAVDGATRHTALAGGPEAFVYVASGNPGFPEDAILIDEWTAGNIVTYAVDDNADPDPATRRAFVVGLDGAESAFRDPLTGGFLVRHLGR